MKSLRTIILFALAAFTILFSNSCRDKEEQGPVLSVNPSELVLTGNAGDLLEFAIVATAGDNELRNLRITQKPDGGITTPLLDTTLFGSHADFFYVYTIPSGTNRVLLNFKLYDSDGKYYETIRDLYVNAGSYLTETTGHQLFSPNFFAGNNAFSIADLTPRQLGTNPDSSLVDITEEDPINDGALNYTLKSLSGIRFVRNNSFNYAQATATSAANSYTSSSAQELVPNIAVDDILITKYDTVLNKYAVIRITGISDLEGTDQDRYTFSVKK